VESLTGIDSLFAAYCNLGRAAFNSTSTIHSERIDVRFQAAVQTTESALLSARDGDLPLASSLLTKAAQQGLSEAVGSEPWIAFVSVYAAATSYLFYRLGIYDKAVSLLEEANLADLLLITFYGRISRHLHRVRLAHHRAKVEWKLGNRRLGLIMVDHLLAHLAISNTAIPPLLSGSWDNRLCLACPQNIVAQMIEIFRNEKHVWQAESIT
jgi:hypothetical protein